MKLIIRPVYSAMGLLWIVLSQAISVSIVLAAEPTVIQFPDRPIGRFNLIKPAADPANDIVFSRDQWAQGKVRIPPGCVLSLTLNFNGSQNTKLIRQMPPKIIRNLTCHDLEIDDKGVADLCTQRDLRAFNLQGTDLTDEGMKHLSHLTELRRLNVCDTLVTDKGLNVLRNMPHLENLNLSRAQVGAGVADKLQTLKNLNMLDLTGTQLKDKEVLNLPRFDNLQTLCLRRNNVTDRCLVSVLRYKNLRTLDLTDTWITLAGLKKLKALPKLTDVWYRVDSLKPAERKELKLLLLGVKLKDGSHEKAVPKELFAPLH